MKTSAIDYLIDYINSEDEDRWLQSVVSCYLNSNEEISIEEIRDLTDDLLACREKEYSINTIKPALGISNLIKLKTLYHESGINALAGEQKIDFNDEVTVLYGLNGSGKSSYFRILQAMIGNIKSSDIIANIYLDNVKDISTNIEYYIDAALKSVPWCNNGEIDDLKTVKVFDSKYSQKFLERKESDEQVLYPYKLYVFSEISQYIDQIKEAANTQLDERINNNITPKMDSFTENERNLFESGMTESDKEHFLSISESFDEDRKNDLIDKQTEIKSVVETNYSDRLKLLENRIRNFEDIKKRVENTLFLWVKRSNEYNEKVSLYEEYKIESENKRKQIEVLSHLPGVDTVEWKEFIKTGQLISMKSEVLNNICPYCHREYDDNSLAIVEAYSVFIKNKIENKLSICESEIKDILNKAIHTKIIEDDYLFEDDEELQLNISALARQVTEYLESLEMIAESITNIEPIEFDIKIIKSKFADLDSAYLDKKTQLEKESTEKDEILARLRLEESKLISQKSIHEQIDIITKYIDEDIKICKLRQRVSGISSNKISRIGKKAHEELLTIQLSEMFNSYLEAFNVSGRDIEFKNSTSKGIQQTELVIKSKEQVTKILSEGEQKAVSLALFLAEIVVAKNKSTIVLDDPVNSFDHKMMDCLSEILLRLDNQVIIFTHNRMFLDSISGSDYGHKCKNFQPNGCNKRKGKHIFIYQVKSEGINENGIITASIDYDAKGYLRAANDLLSQSPFNDEMAVCIQLRNAVDHIIDEIVFNNQIPRKYSIKGVAQNIQWDELKKMASNSEVIDDLKRIFARVSSGQLHVGQVSSCNPPDKRELLQLYTELVSMLS